MDLYLIRHAQSLNNARPVAERVPDPPITDLGKEQARRLAAWLPVLNLTRLITSPFLRTLQTTAEIQTTVKLKPEIRVQLHEEGGCYSGYWAVGRTGESGMTAAQIQQQFPGFCLMDRIDAAGWWARRAHESRSLASRRAAELLARTRTEFAQTDERVAFVMHADIKLRLLEHFHASPLEPPWNTSVSKVEITPHSMRLVDYNCVHHLPDALITQ